MAKFYITYGFGSFQANCFSVVEAENYGEARAKIAEQIGPAFSFCYDESEWARNGTTQAEDYNLREIPLTPMVMKP